MRRILPLLAILLLPVLAWTEDWYALEGGTRSFAGDDVVNTFTESGTLVVREATTVRALFVAGGGGGDRGSTPASPGTDGGGDGTVFNSVLPGGDGADGLGASGGGSGFGTAGTARGGYGGCGTVIVAYDLRPAGTVILVK